MPKVTVIVPNYNHARFLEQRISSVLSQGYQDFEVILMDDASTDDSAAVLARYERHPRVREVVRNVTNTGVPFRQWNAGVARASGDYIWMAESDDYADPRLLQTLVDRLDSYPAAGVAYCQSLAVDEHGTVLHSLKGWTVDLDAERWDSDFVNSGRDEVRRFVALKCTIPNASATLFRRSVYCAVGNADEDFRLSGDWMLWVKMMLASDVAFVAEPLNYFRVHPNSVRQQSRRSAVALLEAMRIYRHVRLAVEVPADVQDQAGTRFLDRWARELSQWRLDPRLNVEIYLTLKQLDPTFHGRLARRLAWALRRRLPGASIGRPVDPASPGDVEP